MTILFEVGSTNYEEEKKLMIQALDKLQSRFEINDGYHFGEPMSKFGWTFFNLWIKSHFRLKIEEKLADMIKKSKGRKPEEKLTNFMVKFFETSDCKVKLKMLEG